MTPRRRRAQFEVDPRRSRFARAARATAPLRATPAQLPIAIERPSGLLVDTLVEAGYPVVPIHPNIVKATRPRYRSHGAKSDATDAYLLADLLRTDGARFQPLAPQSDAIRALRALVRGRDDLVATRVQLANQLRSLLESFWPGAAAVFADIDSPIALAFVQRYPTPASAARCGEKRMAAFCAQHRYCGRRSPAATCSNACVPRRSAMPTNSKPMPSAPSCAALVAELDSPGRADHANSPRASSTRWPSRPTASIIMSLPRAGHVCAAQILAELGDVRERFASDEQLAAEAGVAPLTYQSGKSHSVAFRWACNHRLRARRHVPRRQLAPRTSLGRQRLRQRSRTRLRSPARRPYPRPRLDPRALARLERSQTIRPHPAPRRSKPPLPNHGLTQDVSYAPLAELTIKSTRHPSKTAI